MTLERWHEIHDAWVNEHGDEARPEAVARADDPSAFFHSSNYVQIVSMRRRMENAFWFGRVAS